ncbi:MAG: hypothetical protein ABSA65_20115 [Acidimicrobiales bacterium]|jgi:hypothetical protein
MSNDNRPATQAQTLSELANFVERALPPGWSSQVEKEPLGKGTWRPDAFLRVASPDGENARFIVETKRTRNPASLLGALEQLRNYIENSDNQGAEPLIFSPYLSPRSKDLLEERGVSYIDTTGNVRLMARRPGLFVYTTGATKDPWPDDRPLQSLRGRGAARSVRALVDYRPPYGVRDLAGRAGVPAATLSRVIELLGRDALITRDDKGGVADIDWAGTIRRWSQDYELRRSNRTATFLDPRGVGGIAQKLTETGLRYATTASLAAQRFAPIAPARVAAFYVEDFAAAAKLLQLRPADAGANVLLIEPFDDVVFERTLVREGLVTVAPTQLAVDLLTGPGREPSEGDELLGWMKRNEDAWRT